MKTYYHFTNDKLRNGKPIPKIGEWLSVEGKLIPCQWGLHACEHPYDALTYAPGHLLHKVELGDEIISDGDKVVARKRKIIATIDAAKLCENFARKVALDVMHLWEPNAIIRKYLETGDESIRGKAQEAALIACCGAVGCANFNGLTVSRLAARATFAYENACQRTFVHHVKAVSNACDAGGDHWKYRRWFLGMVEEAFQTNV